MIHEETQAELDKLTARLDALERDTQATLHELGDRIDRLATATRALARANRPSRVRRLLRRGSRQV